ncbi:hypothetical protein N9B82_03300 [Saprospiraceae bacterium]|nr:hypothetical protein [Saprospiraceae bacterium]
MKISSNQAIRKTVFIASFIFLFFVSHTFAQEQSIPEDLFMEIACFKAKGPDAQDFFKKWSKPFHEEMIRQGILVGWDFYTVDYPNGSDCDCRFRAVRVFRGIGTLDKIKSTKTREAIVQKIWPNKTLKDLGAEFQKNVELKHSEVYRLVDALIPTKTKSKIMVVNFMDVKPGDREAYLEMEDAIFKPLHSASNKEGKLIDWFIAEREIPYGMKVKTDYITVDKFDNYEDYFSNNFMELFKSVHPTMNAKEAMIKMAEKRKLIKSEIWRIVPEICADASSSEKK